MTVDKNISQIKSHCIQSLMYCSSYQDCLKVQVTNTLHVVRFRGIRLISKVSGILTETHLITAR